MCVRVRECARARVRAPGRAWGGGGGAGVLQASKPQERE